MRLSKAVVCGVSIFLCFAPSVFAELSPLTKSLRELVNDLTSQYKEENKTSKTSHEAAVTVFPLNCSPALAKKNVGFALSELLTHEFVQVRSFTVVERSELLKSLDEQKLQQSGAIDPDKAVKIGKLIGAELLVLGSVEQINDKYLISVRLVKVENGKVIATGFEDIPAQLFDETARPYLKLVPDEQVLSIYGAYNSHGTSSGGDPFVFRAPFPGDPSQSSQSVVPQDFNLKMAGGGIKYQPTQHIVVDFGFLISVGEPSIGKDVYTSNIYSSENSIGLSVNEVRALVGWKRNFTQKIFGCISAGISRYRFTSSGVGSADDSTVPTLQGNFEFRPQSRIGFGLSVNYDLMAPEWKIQSATGTHSMFKLNPLSIEPTASIYF